MPAKPLPTDFKLEIKLKPWGREIWWAHTANYAAKILEVHGGMRLSLQYHEQKEETMYVLLGEIKMHFGQQGAKIRVKTLLPGDVFHVPPGTVHRIEGVAPVSQICEVSTPHLDDVVRLSDDYNRPEKGNHEELDKKLSQKG